MPKVVIAGNWKMHKTQREALEFLQDFKSHLDETPDDREVVLCAPFTALAVLSKTLHGGRIRLGAQNVHFCVSQIHKSPLLHVPAPTPQTSHFLRATKGA